MRRGRPWRGQSRRIWGRWVDWCRNGGAVFASPVSLSDSVDVVSQSLVWSLNNEG